VASVTPEQFPLKRAVPEVSVQQGREPSPRLRTTVPEYNETAWDAPAALVRGRIYNRVKRTEGKLRKLPHFEEVLKGATGERIAPELGVSAQPLPPKPRCPADVDV